MGRETGPFLMEKENTTCKAMERLDEHGYATRVCGEPATVLVKDRFGRYALPRCDFHGCGFPNVRPIEKGKGK